MNIFINIKKQNGAVSALVTVTILTFFIILTGVYFTITAMQKAQLKSDIHIQEIYKNDVDNIKDVYEELVSKQKIGSIQNCIITLPYSEAEYTGSAITPTPTVKDGSTTLTENTDYTVSYSNNTNVGTATVTVTGKGNYTGTKTETFTIVNPKQPLKNVIIADNYGDKVNYSVTVNGITLGNGTNGELDWWKIFYNDGTTVTMIYGDYLPNSTNLAQNAGLVQGTGNFATYGVKSNTSREDLINKLNDTSKWTSLLTSTLSSKGCTAKGATDLETWVASWNAKGYTPLYTAKMTGLSDGQGGYYIGTSPNPSTVVADVESTVGYGNKLYFPYQYAKIGENYVYGYWLGSYSASQYNYMDEHVVCVQYLGKMYFYDYTITGPAVRPVISLSSSILTSGQDASGAWIIE